MNFTTAQAEELVLNDAELAAVQGGCPPPVPACANYSPAPNYGSAPSYSPAPNYGSAPSYSPAPNYGSAPSYSPAPNYGSSPFDTPSTGSGGCSPSYNIVVIMPSASGNPCGN